MSQVSEEMLRAWNFFMTHIDNSSRSFIIQTHPQSKSPLPPLLQVEMSYGVENISCVTFNRLRFQGKAQYSFVR